MGMSLIDNYDFFISKPTLQHVDDRTYGEPSHCTPIQEQSSCTGFLYENKGSSLPGYYELFESNAALQQVEDVAYGGSHHGIPIHNQRLGIKVEGEHKIHSIILSPKALTTLRQHMGPKPTCMNWRKSMDFSKAMPLYGRSMTWQMMGPTTTQQQIRSKG